MNDAFKEELQIGEEIIFSTKYEEDMIALRTAMGAILPFQMLSDGYRNVIKIILDIATRMCILNPYLKGEALKKTSGIVLIDEVDLSLHPTWQKRIMGILKEQFPRIQFICATHSPFIIQSLEEGELITLDHPMKKLKKYQDALPYLEKKKLVYIVPTVKCPFNHVPESRAYDFQKAWRRLDCMEVIYC